MAKKGYSFGALVDFVESLQWKTNWAVPVGAILPFPKEPLPVGFLKLDGSRFDKDVYKDLFEFLGTDILPNFTNLTPKMIGSDLAASQVKGWEMPQHNHTFSGTTDTQGAHDHDRGNMEISGEFGCFRPSYQHATGAFSQYAGGTSYTGTSNMGGLLTNFFASRSWVGRTSSNGAHQHNISGTTANAGNSTKVEVDRIGVIYAIKAYGHVEEGYEVQFSSLITSIQNLSRTIEDTNKRIDVSRDRMKDQVGVPIPWGGAQLPAGYIKMNGQSFDKVKNPKLADMYPSGRVPDLRGEFLRGLDDGRGVDAGRVGGSWQSDINKAHAHWFNRRTGTTAAPVIEQNAVGSIIFQTNQGATSIGSELTVNASAKSPGGSSGSYTGNGDVSVTIGSDGGTETRPRNIAMLYICMTDTAINF